MLKLFLAISGLLLMGFYRSLEVAFAHTNWLTLELEKKQGRPQAQFLCTLRDQPTRFTGIALVGYYLIFITGLLVFSTDWSMHWNTATVNRWFTPEAVFLFTLAAEIIFFVAILYFLGEWLPPVLSRLYADLVVKVSGSLQLLQVTALLLGPVSKGLIRFSIWILDVFLNAPIRKKSELLARIPVVADLNNATQQSPSAPLNTDLLEAALLLPTIRVRECLVPRKEIEAIEKNSSIAEVRKKMIASKLSKLVVYDQTIDHIVGYIHQLDLFQQPKTIQEILLSIPAIPETMGAHDLIHRLNKERKSMAWVVDEFGGTAGIVTMEDLLEEIFGEIRDEFDVEELEEKKVSDQEYIFSGRLELDYLRETYALDFPHQESETLSGYIIHHLETIPRPKEQIRLGAYLFEILQVSDTRIERVKLNVLT
ncbi:MAG: hemolysin family protein [Chitinophagaceae bacterium]